MLKRSREASGPEEVQVANLGILEKMTGAAAIVNTNSYIDRSSGRLRIWTSLKVLGTYGEQSLHPDCWNCANNVEGVYISNLKDRNLDDDFMALIFGMPIAKHCVKVNDTCENVLEIDTTRAWKESDSKASWSNEVAVEIIVR
jgi:hypothetical protein